jgi:hypothetical protein
MAAIDPDRKIAEFTIAFAGGSEEAVRLAAFHLARVVGHRDLDPILLKPDGKSRLTFELSGTKSEKGWQSDFQVITLPFQEDAGSRVMTLKGADAMIFVWDGRAPDSAIDLAAWKALQPILADLGKTLERFAVHPVLLRPGQGASWTDEMPAGKPGLFTVNAEDGDGIMEAFKAASRSALASVTRVLDE